MKKFLLTTILSGLSVYGASGETLFQDSFDYADGDLQGKGLWVFYGSKSSNPIQVGADPLTFAGYADDAVGKAVTQVAANGNASDQAIFRPEGQDAVTGTVYYAATVKITGNIPTTSRVQPLLALSGADRYSQSNYIGDGIAGSLGGGLYVRPGDADGKFQFGIGRGVSYSNGASKSDISWADGDYDLNTVYLVVLSYTKVDGDNNDTMQLWINPAETGQASVAAEVTSESTADETLYDIRGFYLSQQYFMTSKMPDLVTDNVRVATGWNEIFHPAGAPADVPELTLSVNSVNFGSVFSGVAYQQTVTVTGSNLTGDVKVAVDGDGLLSVSPSVLPADDVNSAEGVEVTVTLDAAESRFSSGRVTFDSDGAVQRVLNASWSLVPSEPGTTLREFYDDTTHDMSSVYVYTGHAVVTFVDSYYDSLSDRVVNSLFIEDNTAAVEVRSAGGCGYDEISIEGVKEGDVITDLIGSLVYSDGGVYFIPKKADSYSVVDHGKELTPTVMTLGEIQRAEPADVMFRLVTVPDVEFDKKYRDDPDLYNKFNSQKYNITDSEGSYGEMWRFDGADYRDQPAEEYFNSVWDMTGIVYDLMPLQIGPRSFADFKFVKKIDGDDGDDDDDEDSIGVVDAVDADAPVEYFTLQGVRVDRPAQGSVVIRRQGDVVSKIVVR